MGISDTLIKQSKQPTGYLGGIMLRIMGQAHRRLAKWAVSKLAGGGYALDVGCGGGYGVKMIAQTGKFSYVWGVDISNKAVLLANAANQKLIAEGRVKIIEGDVSQLPFDDCFFGAVTTIRAFVFAERGVMQKCGFAIEY